MIEVFYCLLITEGNYKLVLSYSYFNAWKYSARSKVKPLTFKRAKHL